MKLKAFEVLALYHPKEEWELVEVKDGKETSKSKDTFVISGPEVVLAKDEFSANNKATQKTPRQYDMDHI